jgi:pilus assembly protein CpaB
MSPRRIVFILIALLASGATIFLGRAWLSAERNARVVQQAPEPAKPATMVLVAQGDLHAGQFMRPENLRWQAWPDDGLAKSYVVTGQHQLEDFVGAVVRSSVGDGEPITEARIVRPGDRGFLAAVLTPGYRAITVPVTAASGNAGFIFPGDHVDVRSTTTRTRTTPTTSITPARPCSPICGCSRSTSVPTTRARTSRWRRRRRSKSRPSRPRSSRW